MRWRAGILVAVALSGCKNLDKGKDDRSPPPPYRGSPASKTKNPHWLDGPDSADPGGADLPPKSAPARTTADPRSPGFDTKTEARGTLAGFVDDPEGRKLRGVYIEIEPATGPGGGKPVGVQTDDQGYFLVTGLKTGQTYVLTASAARDGRKLGGQVYVRPPNQFVKMSLVEGIAPSGKVPASPVGGGSDLPAPAPAASVPSFPPTPPPAPDGSWSPVSPSLPRGDSFPPPRSDLRTDGPNPGVRPPAANIPSPTILPPPAFPGEDPGRTESRSVKPKPEFVLLDTLGRPREFPTGDPRDLVLMEFMTTVCVPCKKAIPVLKDFQTRYGARGVELIGVVCDPVDVPQRRAIAGRYQRDNGLAHLLYVEPGHEPGAVMDRFGVEFYPTLVLLSGTGEVLWKGDPRHMDKLEQVVRDRLGPRDRP